MVEPNYFLITGMPKSGNKWLHNMVFELDGIGGFANHPRDGLPVLARWVWDETSIQDFCREHSRSFEAFVRRLYNPADPTWEPLNSEQAEAIKPSINRLLSAAKRRVDPQSRSVERQHFSQLFGSDHHRDLVVAGKSAIGAPSMHIPISEIVEKLPGFRIVHVQRDPRDVVVSYFFHLIGTLRTGVAEEVFVHRDRSGKLGTRVDWKQRYANWVWRRFKAFFDGPVPTHDGIITTRYEDLLSQASAELERIASFLGTDTTLEQRQEIAQRHSFVAKTRSTVEQRNSTLRKGQSGDWRNYFDQELLRGLGNGFRRLVVELGYESNSNWVESVPHRAPRDFDFSRFRIRRSTCRYFIELWMTSPELQARYADPWDYGEGDTFYHWLRRHDADDHDAREIAEWIKLADQLVDLWGVDIFEARD